MYHTPTAFAQSIYEDRRRAADASRLVAEARSHRPRRPNAGLRLIQAALAAVVR